MQRGQDRYGPAGILIYGDGEGGGDLAEGLERAWAGLHKGKG